MPGRKQRHDFVLIETLDTNRRYTVLQAADYLQKRYSTINRDIKAGLVRIIREGARVFVSGQELQRLSTLVVPFTAGCAR